jgi:hypothetical protein
MKIVKKLNYDLLVKLINLPTDIFKFNYLSIIILIIGET